MKQITYSCLKIFLIVVLLEYSYNHIEIKLNELN